MDNICIDLQKREFITLMAEPSGLSLPYQLVDGLFQWMLCVQYQCSLLRVHRLEFPPASNQINRNGKNKNPLMKRKKSLASIGFNMFKVYKVA